MADACLASLSAIFVVCLSRIDLLTAEQATEGDGMIKWHCRLSVDSR